MYIGGRWLLKITTFELNLIPGFYDCLLRLQSISNKDRQLSYTIFSIKLLFILSSSFHILVLTNSDLWSTSDQLWLFGYLAYNHSNGYLTYDYVSIICSNVYSDVLTPVSTSSLFCYHFILCTFHHSSPLHVNILVPSYFLPFSPHTKACD